MIKQTARYLFLHWLLFTFACIAAISYVGPNLFAADYAAKVRADNPIAYWRFEETSGSTAAEEISSRNGTYQNIVHRTQSAYAGLGNAAEFNGNTSTISVPALGTVGSMTIEAWVQPYTLSSSGVHASLYNVDGGGSHWQFYANRFEWALGFSDVTNSYQFSANRWYHIVTMYDANAGNGYLFVNGQFAETLFTGVFPINKSNNRTHRQLARELPVWAILVYFGYPFHVNSSRLRLLCTQNPEHISGDTTG